MKGGKGAEAPGVVLLLGDRGFGSFDNHDRCCRCSRSDNFCNRRFFDDRRFFNNFNKFLRP